MQAYVLLHCYSFAVEQTALPHTLTGPKLKMTLVAVYKKASKNGLIDIV
jgi:hypothetical protein